MTWDELLDRLFDRYTVDMDEADRQEIRENIVQDAYVELAAFIGYGIDQGDLSDEEIDAALKFSERTPIMKRSLITDALEELKASRAST
ncbi:hypothetical protein [Rhodococcus sp. NPDC049939]|uniref:hypothetical protein n=1 Tax=Rhodococcus sp. NPDC049939 TaxID=3155511 RepID=UPI0033D3BE4A